MSEQSQEEHDLIWCGLTEQKWRLERHLGRLRSIMVPGLGLFIGLAFGTTMLWLSGKTRAAIIETVIVVALGIAWLVGFRVYRRGQRVVRDVEKLLS